MQKYRKRGSTVAEKSQERVAVEIAYGRRTSTSVNLTTLIRYETTVRESWLAMVSTGVRNFGRRDVMRIKSSPVTPLTPGFERVSEEQQPGSPGPGCMANIYFATGEKRAT